MRDFTGRQQSDSPLDQHVKMGVLGYFALRPELVGDLSASKNRTDKCPMIIRPFKTVSPKNVAQNLYVRFDLCFSTQCVTLSVSKSKLQQADIQATDGAPQWEREKKTGEGKKKEESSPLWPRGHQGDRQY